MIALAGARWFHDRSFLPSDTQEVLAGVLYLDDCAHAGIWSRCELRVGPVSPFPVMQYAIGFASKGLGGSYATTAQLLVRINAFSVLAAVLLLAFAARRLVGPRAHLLLLLAMVTGPLLWYSQAGFAEGLATFLTLSVFVCLLRGSPALPVALLAFAAGLTKETAPIFLVALAGVWAIRQRRSVSALAAVASGALGAAIANGLFNVWRYGSFYNDYYAEPARHTPGVARKAEFFGGQLVAPNAGLLWFWPLGLVVILIVIYAGLRSANLDTRRAALAFTGVVIALLGLFAAYHSPYGYNAFGPRYLLPWVPSLGLTGAWLARDELERLLCLGPKRLAAAVPVGLLVAAIGWAQIGALLDPLAPLRIFEDSTPPCLYRAGADLMAYEQPNYYACLRTISWKRHSVLLDSLEPAKSPLGISLGLLMALTIGAAVPALRASPKTRPDLGLAGIR